VHPSPEQVAELNRIKTLIPAEAKQNHALIDFLINARQNGVPVDIGSRLDYVALLAEQLAFAHIETVVNLHND
jgi:hypothetical protein